MQRGIRGEERKEEDEEKKEDTQVTCKEQELERHLELKCNLNS